MSQDIQHPAPPAVSHLSNISQTPTLPNMCGPCAASSASGSRLYWRTPDDRPQQKALLSWLKRTEYTSSDGDGGLAMDLPKAVGCGQGSAWRVVTRWGV